jgi:biopolymer transport protein ExbD
MYRRKQQYNIMPPKKFTLNITSMADMFTILLVFLLQSYSVAEFKVDPVQGLELPISSTMVNPTQSQQIILTKNELKLGERVLATLDQIDSKNRKIEPLYQALNELKIQNPDAKWVQNGEIIFQADRSQSYSTIQKVMFTASQAGFPKLRLATLSGD